MAKSANKTGKVLSRNLFPVVGVGASAGGLQAFKELVKSIPRSSGMAYIFVQHMAPQHESLLADILQKLTTIPVVEITDNLQVKPDHIYIIPPNKMLTANDGVLLVEPLLIEEKSYTVDIFFSSLAEIHQEYAIGVVLSGTGSDGTVGLKTIKDQGGITIAQDESASYDGMPKSAITADVVDHILRPSEIPTRLLELIQGSEIPSPDIDIAEDSKDEDIFRQILAFVRAKRGVDFTYYKQTTIRRRILRRKGINKSPTLKEYQNYLFENKSEQDALFQDILIPVTAFFRDPKTFMDLAENIYPVLFSEKPLTEPIRIWVAGCSTGEEAYSIAISLHEYFGDTIESRNIQVFATDISETAISKARRGIYQKKDMAGLGEARIKQFFTKIDGSYQVNKMIRQICVFACQNFLKDPPFAKLDLVSCRNVLIYLQPYLQKKAIATFHYALNPSGFLLLGKSETVGQSSDQFHQFVPQEKFYQKRGSTGKFMQVTSEKSEVSLKTKDDQQQKALGGKYDFQKAADDALLARMAAVGAVVNEQLDIIQFRGSTGNYLEAKPGKASFNILKMAREGLSFELRNALHKAKTAKEPVRKENIPIDKGTRKISIEVIPLRNTIELCFLVLFEEEKEQAPIKKANRRKKSTDEQRQQSNEAVRVEQLEKELAEAREDMRGITEDQEASNEELQSANEELLSSSEELQSLNEELETTKEEIQSTNEELTILNQELLERNDQLVYSRKYAEAIVSTIHEPLIILTKDLRVKSANKAFYKKFELTENETQGRMFFELSGGKWDVPGLKERLLEILPKHRYVEKFEMPLTLPSSARIIIHLNARQLINENSNEQLILLALQDITEQKAFEGELESQVQERTSELHQSNLNLQHSNENLQQFASIASHDLQEPLRKVKTFTALLNRRFNSEMSDESKDIIAKIEKAADRMAQLIKEVLEYSRLVRTTKEFRETDLDAVLQDVMNDLDLLISDTNAVVHYKRRLPEIEAIPLQMHQLFYNLLNNSLKFRKQSVDPVITIAFRKLLADVIQTYPELNPEREYLEIEFSDNGIGFDQQFSVQIFQLFERLHSISEFEGTGLGLALCKKIVENHHGIIFAESKEGEGATLSFILPITQ